MTTQQIIENQQRDSLRKQLSEALKIAARNASVKFEPNSVNVGNLNHGDKVCSYSSFFGEVQLFYYGRLERRPEEPDESFTSVWADANNMCWQSDSSGMKYTSEQLAQYMLKTLVSF
ncbi:MAG: hypothetical protein K2Z81_10995 [Cyanobacteria bacterium]|nr:hypothetical protein [Cyanobacteriota bacterium]